MDALLALVRKDLRLYFSNRRAVLVTLAAPILIAAFFGAVLGGAPSKPTGVAVAVVDQDASDVSRALVTALKADTLLRVETLDEATARDRVQKGKVRVAIVIPQGFGAGTTRAVFRPDLAKPSVRLYVDPSQAMTIGMVKGVVAQYAMREIGRNAFSLKRGIELVAEQREAVKSSTDMNDDVKRDLLTIFDRVESLQSRASDGKASSSSGPLQGGFTLPFNFQQSDVTAGSRPYNAYAHSFAGMGVQFVLFMGIELGVGVLLMRRMGIWKRLRAAPVSRGLLLSSRIASGTLIASILMACIYAAGIAFFQVRIDGSFAGFVAIAIAFAWMTSTFGLLIAALGRTPEATRGLAILATLLLVMLGGAWVPTFIFPQWLQQATVWVPTRWAVDGLEAMTWRGLGIDAAIVPVAVMVGYGVAFAAIAVKGFRWEE